MRTLRAVLRGAFHIGAICWFWFGCILGGEFRACAAEQFLSRVWQTEQGLPQNTVTSIAQTRDGYLWIGTQHGLARFDGVQFSVYTSANAPAFKSDRISALLANGDELWVGTEGGGVVCCRNGQFTNWSVLDGLSSDMVTSLAPGTNSSVWVGTAFGLNRVENGRVTTYSAADGLPGIQVLSLATDATGQLWIGTERGLARLSGGKIEAVGDAALRVERLLTDLNGDVWSAGESFGLQLVNRNNADELNESLALGTVTALGLSRSGALWVGLGAEGLERVESGELVEIEHPPLEAPVLCVHEDREENLWIGTRGGGLVRLTPRILVTFTHHDGLPDDVINALTEDAAGRLWVGGQFGDLALFENDHFSRVALSERQTAQSPILSLCGVPDGSVWIGTRGNGAWVWRSGTIGAPNLDGNPLPAVSSALFVDRTGGLWIGSEAEGVTYIRGEQVKRFTSADGLSRNEAICIAETPDGSIWLGTRNAGLNRIKSGVVTHFGTAEGLPSEAIRALHTDAEGTLWIGTSAGLSVFRNEHFFNFSERQGLLDDIVAQIVNDNSGHLWLGCNRGLLRVRRAELIEVADGTRSWVSAVPFGKQDGMLNTECLGGLQSAALKDRNGNLWFSTLRGLVRVTPPVAPPATKAPAVHLEQVWLNDAEVISDPIIAGNNPKRENIVRVPPGGAKLEFRFTATSLRAPEKIRFRYRMENFESEWINAGGNRRALYSRLPTGEYRFHVTACNEEGVWNTDGATVAVVVQPHYWETVSFKAAIVLACLGLIGGALWTRRMRQRELERLRLRIAGDLHDDLGSNLSSIALLSRRVGRQAAELPAVAKAELEEIEQIARKTTHAIRDIVWFIAPDYDTLAGLADRMREVAAVMLAEVEHEFRMTDISGSTRISPEFRRNIFLVFKEAIHNVVQHAQCTRVEIEISIRGGNFFMIVRDNGRGMPADSSSNGNGLKQMQLRMARLGGQCTIESQPGSGTTMHCSARLQ